MALVERNDGKVIKICSDEIASYAGPGMRIFSSMEQYRAQKGIAENLTAPLSRPGSLDTRAALVPKNGVWSRREGMDGQ